MFKTDKSKKRATNISIFFLIYFIVAGLIGFAPLNGINFCGALICIVTIIYCAPEQNDVSNRNNNDHHNLTT